MCTVVSELLATALWKDLYKMKPSVYVQAILPFVYRFIHFQSQHILPHFLQ